ncbi:DNA-3-methyladenine glycosylase 2 family protein [Rhizobium sp. CG5]|uniref:DNA-3-methyladenine glycosylase family protein n=1 Tax=Rhizobium sp. CG5 TaxID=2726076 RepID=UPI0020335C59|nr:DNA-3-methyladenine glycosylase [Rhizobium sp. CG5]MCM2475197.1 DNA-3-methyladenine glycosylase 2 family protein [Rhizobium sp. CG5]
MKIIGADSDVALGLDALLRLDPRLHAVATVAGPLPLRLAEPGFAGLAFIVVSQMVSKASAEAIWRRIVAATGVGRPTAEAYLALDEASLAGLGLSRAKAHTLRLVAEAVQEGQLDLQAIVREDGKDAITRLTDIRGIGPWTAEVYLMFCGGHPDVFPAGDVALRIAIGRAFGLEERPDIRSVGQMAEIWSPWRSVAARLFWAYYAATSGREAAPVGLSLRPIQHGKR